MLGDSCCQKTMRWRAEERTIWPCLVYVVFETVELWCLIDRAQPDI